MIGATTTSHDGPLFIARSSSNPDGARIDFGSTWIALSRVECDALILGLTHHLAMLDKEAAAEQTVIEVTDDA